MLIFDAVNKRIILDSATITATELYSRSADWLAQSDNAKYGAVFRQVGGDDLGGGLSIPPYYFLQGLWRVRPMETSHNLTIIGNLFVDGGGVPVVNTIGTFQVNVNYTVPVQAQGISTSGVVGPTAADIAAATVTALTSRIIENGLTNDELMKLMASVLLGKLSGAGSGYEIFRDLADTKDRVKANIDNSGNRLAIVLDAT